MQKLETIALISKRLYFIILMTERAMTQQLQVEKSFNFESNLGYN